MVLGRQAHRFETRCAHADELDVRAVARYAVRDWRTALSSSTTAILIGPPRAGAPWPLSVPPIQDADLPECCGLPRPALGVCLR